MPVNRSQYGKAQARTLGLRRVRSVTRWTVAGSIAAAIGAGGAFAHAHLASTTAGTTQTSTSDQGTGSTSDRNGTITAPTQAPGLSGNSGGQVRSGGS